MKVGKAIYNILSRAMPVQQNIGFSTDTFAPSGEELITNGNFSATGSELVTNGDFSATGSEVAVNGDFSINSGWGSNNTISSGQLTKTAAGLAFQQYAGFASAAKSYKCVVDVAEENGANFTLYVGGAQFALNVGVNTLYIVNGTSNPYLGFNDGNGSIVNSISIKELGENWTATNAVLSFANSQMIVNDSLGAGDDSRGTQIITTEVGKIYNLSYNRISTTSSFYLAIGSNGSGSGYKNIFFANLGTTTGVYTRQFKATSTTTYIGLITAGTGVTVYSTVSVKEVGEGWTVSSSGDGAIEFTAQGLKITNGGSNGQAKVIQQSIFENGKTYKFSYKIVAYNGGDIGLAGESAAMSKTPGDHFAYLTRSGDTTDFILGKANTNTNVTVTNISVQEMVLTKIFPEIAPPDIDPPYIVYSVVSNQPSNTKNENGEIDEASLEVYSFQDTYNKTVDLGVAVRASLDRVNGTFATVKVDSINYTNEQMDVNESRKLWAAIQDYTVRIKNI